MAVTFELIEDRNVKRMLTDIIDQFHPELAEVKATFLLQWAIAAPDKKTGEIPPAIKLHGSPKLATVKVVNLKDRVAGLPDARLLIDKHRWDEHTTAQQRAIIDHEASHVICSRDEDGAPKSDDIGRPVLKTRPGDWDFDGFAAVVKRHGEDSIEIMSLKTVMERFVQPNFLGELVEAK